MDASEARASVTEFLTWVKGLLPADKYQTFLQLFQFPVSTNDLTEEIFLALEKVYDGKDAYEEYNFLSPEQLDDWQDYRNHKLDAYDFWRHEAYERFKTNINGFIVVDLGREQQTEKPEPYFYFLPITDVRDFSNDSSGQVEWLMFDQPEERIAVFDDTSYRIFKLTDKGELDGEPELEVPHDLGECPAAFFWKDPLKNNQPAIKKSPISNQLTALDWLLFFQTSKKHLDLYAPYPIYSGFQQECDFENADNGDFCEGGFLKNAGGDYYVDRAGHVSKCPVCADKSLAGVGSFISVPTPNRENDMADLRNPVQITSVDRQSLDYNVEECDRLQDAIYRKVVGVGGEMKLDKAFNEDQVKANTESRRNVLISIKKNFERIQSWTEDIICRLRYGDYYVGNTIFYGSDFYLYTADELTKQYKEAKAAGATDYQLDILQDQIIETENKNNPQQMARAEILKHLEPYRHQTRSEVLNMLSQGFGNKELISVKLNFATFVLRFERENTDLVEFGSALSFEKKISIILKTFINYGREQIQEPKGGEQEPGKDSREPSTSNR